MVRKRKNANNLICYERYNCNSFRSTFGFSVSGRFPTFASVNYPFQNFFFISNKKKLYDYKANGGGCLPISLKIILLKKYIPKAVDRNKIKRRLKSAINNSLRAYFEKIDIENLNLVCKCDDFFGNSRNNLDKLNENVEKLKSMKPELVLFPNYSLLKVNFDDLTKSISSVMDSMYLHFSYFLSKIHE